MASQEAKIRRRAIAIVNLEADVRTLATHFGVEVPPLPGPHYGDQEYKAILELERYGATLKAIADIVRAGNEGTSEDGE
jgi:hypothetical protein